MWSKLQNGHQPEKKSGKNVFHSAAFAVGL